MWVGKVSWWNGWVDGMGK